MSTDEPHDALPDLPPRKPPSRRDPFDTDLLTMHDQALSIVVQLRGIPKVRAALPAVHHDADQLADHLYAVAKEADLRRMRSEQAHTTLRWRRGLSDPLIEEAQIWVAHVAVTLKLVPPSPAIATVHATTTLPRRTATPCLNMMAEVLRALEETGLASDVRLAGPHAAGVDLRDRLAAHVEAIRLDVLNDRELSRVRAEARAKLLAELRRVRAIWAAASTVTPGGLPPMDLRIVLAKTGRREAAGEPAVEPTDAQGGGAGQEGVEGGVVAPVDGVPGGSEDPCAPDEGEPWVRVEVRRGG
jgi:hypothetical protein